jgi:hypothetical protein
MAITNSSGRGEMDLTDHQQWIIKEWALSVSI